MNNTALVTSDGFKNKVTNLLPTSMKKNSGRFLSMMISVSKALENNTYVSVKSSILPTMLNAANLGLECDPSLGLIYFIPYKGKLTYQIGYKGMITLARRSGQVKSIRTGLVYEKEIEEKKWSYYENETGQHFHHEPIFGGDKGKEVLGYSVVTMADGTTEIHTMESAHIDAIKKMSLARTKNGPWGNPLFEPEMRKKTVIRRHMKTLPMSVEMAQAVQNEEAVERGEDSQELDISDLVEVTEENGESPVLPPKTEPKSKPAPKVKDMHDMSEENQAFCAALGDFEDQEVQK